MAFNKAIFDAVISALKEQDLVTYGPRVLILRDEEADTTAGGLFIPDEAKKREKWGTVVQLGLGFEAESEDNYVSGVCVGHRVSMNQYDQKEFEIDTHEFGFVLCDSTHIGNLYMGRRNPEVT